MALTLKTVEPARGMRWITDAFRLYRRRPLGFIAMFAVFVVVFVMVSLVPVVGALAMFALPLLSLGFMVAARSALLDGPVRFTQYIEPLRTDPRRRRALLGLCLIYGSAMLLIVWLADTVSGDAIARFQALITSGSNEQALIEALQSDGGLRAASTTLALLGSLLSIPFWHAAPLVHWGGQGVWQSLFSSTLALWRSRGAFALYALVWVAMATLPLPVIVLLVAVLLGTLGAPQLTLIAVWLVWAVFWSVFYISVLFTFNDSFGVPSSPPSEPDVGGRAA